jgi:hypothetical protein
MGNIPAVEKNPPGCGFVLTADEIKQGGLTRSVGADDGLKPEFLEPQVDPFDGDIATKPHGQILGFDDRCLAHSGLTDLNEKVSKKCLF